MRMDDFREEKAPRSVKICLLLPPKDCKFNIEALKSELLGFQESEKPMVIPENENRLKIQKLDNLFSDDDAQIDLTSKIDRIENIGDTGLIFTSGSFEEYSSFIFRDTRFYYPRTIPFGMILIPILENTEVYVLMLLKKEKSKILAEKLKHFLNKLGIRILEGRFLDDDIDDIRMNLDGRLKDTILKDFSSPKITQKRIYGNSFEDDESYLRDKEEGKIYSHQMSISNPQDPDQRITIGISRDGFVRFYNITSLESMVIIFHNLQNKLRFYRIGTLDAFIHTPKTSKLFDGLPSEKA